MEPSKPPPDSTAPPPDSAAPPADSTALVMKIPHIRVENIKSMQETGMFGARIQFIPLYRPPFDKSKKRTVKIDGTNEEIEAAKQMIEEVIKARALPLVNQNRRDRFERKNGILRFVGGKQNASHCKMQNSLTKLGRDVAVWSTLPYRKRLKMTPELQTYEMQRLLKARLLRIRNGDDIDGVVYLVNKFGFKNTIQVHDKDMERYVSRLIETNRRNQCHFLIKDPQQSSDEESDEEDGSLQKNDSDNDPMPIHKPPVPEGNCYAEDEWEINSDAMSDLEKELKFKGDGSDSDSEINFDCLYYGGKSGSESGVE